MKIFISILLLVAVLASSQNPAYTQVPGRVCAQQVSATNLKQRGDVYDEDSDLDGIVDSFQDMTSSIVIRETSTLLDTGDVVHSIPAPGASCQGLTWDGTHLWVSDIAVDAIYKVSPVDGSILGSFASPGGFVEGLAWDGTYLWAAENGGGSASVDTIYQLDTTNGAIVHSFQSPGNWPHGITWDGTNMWINDFDTELIDKVDPSTGRVLASIPAPGDKSIGLTWDGRYLWSDDIETGLLYQIDTLDGAVIRTVPSPHYNARDLAWDGQYLWVLSWQAATIFQVDVGGNGMRIDVVSSSPTEYTLSQNRPNPFNPVTEIKYALPKDCHVKLDVFNILGQKVTTLVDGNQKAGYKTARWDAGSLSSGIYFYRLRAGDFVQTRKMVVLK
jgi:hypothetical protein